MSTERVVYLSLGSNLGDRLANLRGALAALARSVDVNAIASLYETPPSGVLDQPSFLNSACGVATALSLSHLLRVVKRIEWEMGRRPAQVWGPRPLDIDILLAGNETVQTPRLEVPHPRFPSRGFQTVPMTDIAPHVHHPLLGLTTVELWEALPAKERDGLARVAGPEWVT
jgi:2-amino-4-hydroxy-6-hydroxymethyldihydropteridine diphosphokinase